MKKIVVLALALVVAPVSGAFALDTATVQVSANVLATCGFDTNGTLPFGALDAGSGLDVNANSSDVTFTCSAGVGYTITDNNGVNGVHNMVFGGNLLPYSFNYVGAGVATGASQPLAISGTVLYADYAGLPAGLYQDTVTLTINP